MSISARSALRLLRPTKLGRAALAGPSRLARTSVPARTLTTSRTIFHGPLKTSAMMPAAEAPGSVAPSVTAQALTVEEYEKHANEAMDTLHDNLEALVEEYSPEGANGWECEYSSGVLTLSLGPHGTYVINKQPPNQQIWLSSPFSGPMRFSFAKPTPESTEGTWIYARDDTSLGALIDREVRSVLVSEVGQEEADAWVGAGIE